MTPYSEKVLDHYENPRHAGAFEKTETRIGAGTAGTPDMGQVTRIQIRVNSQGHIEEARFKTYGSPPAIAASSLAAEWLTGKTLDEALALTSTEIARELSLPAAKIHCALLVEDAVKAAVADYRRHDSRKNT